MGLGLNFRLFPADNRDIIPRNALIPCTNSTLGACSHTRCLQEDLLEIMVGIDSRHRDEIPDDRITRTGS
jgi:hypothetical protein